MIKAGANRKFFSIVLGIFSFALFTLYQSRRYVQTPSSMNLTRDATSIPHIPSLDGTKKSICPSTISIFHTGDDFAILRAAIMEAEAFHDGGGNLKSIENYLNSHIDDTFKKLNIEFTPNDGKGAPSESISAEIKDLLQAKDVHNRGGYDQRSLPGSFKPNNQDILHGGSQWSNGRSIDVLEPFNLNRWEAGIGPIAKVCKSVDTIKGRKTYDDKFMCSFDDIQNNMNSTDSDQEKCEMISIGSNKQWGFEENIVATTKCATHTFDCTVSSDPRKPNVDSINFYPFCISSKNEVIKDREYMTYSKMIEKTGMTTPPALFKMDVEGFEYDVMTQMLDEAVASGSSHLLPSQISVELHYATRMYDVPWMLRTVTSAEIAMFMGMMYKRGGYMLVNYAPIGPGCYSCAEFLFVRVLCD